MDKWRVKLTAHLHLVAKSIQNFTPVYVPSFLIPPVIQ
jgi:hypothetical protein